MPMPKRYYTYHGRQATLGDLAEAHGLLESTVRSRMSRGQALDQALAMPAMGRLDVLSKARAASPWGTNGPSQPTNGIQNR